MSPYRLVYGKPCHLPVEIEHRTYWAIRQFNDNENEVEKNRKLQLDELEELRNDAFENAKISKHKMKTLHDKHILRKSFHDGQKVLLYNSRLHLFLGKLRTKWIGPFMIKSISEHGAFEVENSKNGNVFKVNGHRLKSYLEKFMAEVETLDLEDPIPLKNLYGLLKINQMLFVVWTCKIMDCAWADLEADLGLNLSII
jgi:hypothetical protein